MILVADSGSTKTNWALLQPNQEINFFDTEGYNPYFIGSQHIVSSLSTTLPLTVNPAMVKAIYFYGAGCFEDKAIIIETALREVFSHAAIHVGLDMLGSARSVLGDKPGFAAILGTGTNSCLYDGKKITANIDSLGYLLGDEGSGYYIGRKLLGDYIRGYMPSKVRENFYETYKMSREEIMHRIYSEKLPNRFCAAFTQFITDSVVDIEYTHNLVREGFMDFFRFLVTRYAHYEQFSFNCTGSVAFTFRKILSQTAIDFNMEVGTILKSPIQGLAIFHSPDGFPQRTTGG